MAAYDDELLTYREAGQRLGVHPDSVMRRAKRQGWERVEGNAKTDPVRIRVPAAVLAEPWPSSDRAQRTPRISADALATLGAALERQEVANKVLQATLDAARAEKALAQIDIVKADTLRLAAEKGADDLARRLEREEAERRTFQGLTDALRAELSAAEVHAAKLQAKLDALETKLQATLDAARAEMALARIETGRADTLRLAAEKDAEDLARRLESGEIERRALQEQTDAVRLELSAAEAHAADLQAQLAALETKLHADLDAARAEMALARIETGNADTLRLAAEQGADDLARRLEREETERRALQDQTDALRLELSAAEAHAADLQAQFAALETKLQADLDAARAEMALARIETGKAETLRLAAEQGADDLARRLEREEAERRTLQEQTDAVRLELSAAEAHAVDLQARFAALQTKLQADLDAARAEMALARIETGKADTLRLAAEKGADDLARRLEREEAERRALQDQTDAVRVELSAAEAHAADLQARFAALETKLQADLDAARAEMALARIETGKAETLRLAAEQGADDLARRLEREEAERRALQDQTDAVRVELSAAEAHAADLQARFDALETKLQADLDAARAEMALARIETGKADTLRLAAEKGAEDLARRLEREETERRTLKGQTDAVRLELSAAEAHAADLQAKFDALQTKLQADLDAARAEMALARIETGKADTLRLAAEKGADDLARRLEREEAERRALQDQSAAVRLELSAAEARAADLQAKFDALQTKLQADLDAARAEMALARIETGKADTLRLAAEKGAEDLARRLEREETERRTLKGQTDAVRLELSAAEAHAADLQAKFDALQTKRQTVSPDGRESILWQQHAAHRIRELEHQLEVLKAAGSGRSERVPSPGKRSWWWPFRA